MRQAQKISREKLAALIGISPQQLTKYEMRYNQITVDRLIDIAKILNLKISNFFVFVDLKNAKKFSLSSAQREYRLFKSFREFRKLSTEELAMRMMEMLVK